jgi:hypothetical protein
MREEQRQLHEKVVELERGLFSVVYRSADDRAFPPKVLVSAFPGSERDVEFLLHPDALDPTLWTPGASIVLRTKALSKIKVEIVAIRPDGSHAATVQLAPITQGLPPQANYVFDLGGLEGPFTDGEGSRVVEFVLGIDVDLNTVAVMSVILFTTEDNDKLELCFGIRTKSGANLSKVSPPDYSKEAADLYIPKAARERVLSLINSAIGLVVDARKPSFIIMETFYPNLEERALRKYDSITKALRVIGYPIRDSWRDEYTNIDYWLFERRE